MNFLELTACFLGIKSLCSGAHDTHIRLNMDNTTSCAYISHFVGGKNHLNKLAVDIWDWARQRNIWLSSAFIRGAKNTEADKLSRSFNDDLEWSLDDKVFQDIYFQFPDINVDLFASNLDSIANYPIMCHIDLIQKQWQ